MSENETSDKIMADIGELVQSYIDKTRKQGNVPTRDDIIGITTNRLEELLKIGSEKKEIMWIVSGVAIGIAIVLQIEDRLNMEEY